MKTNAFYITYTSAKQRSKLKRKRKLRNHARRLNR
ncbi:hypothetical protein GR11A_00068 [Vibrio phage vB_VcorM_GR11A]|nr:hypothetical protein GR11A_00068 [Vibrio phage vB_VcorM_GR11A]